MTLHQACDGLTWARNSCIAWPRLAWIEDPHNNPHPGLAHATYDDSTHALCGAHTSHLGELWPRLGDYWSSACSRCPACALRLYSGRM